MPIDQALANLFWVAVFFVVICFISGGFQSRPPEHWEDQFTKMLEPRPECDCDPSRTYHRFWCRAYRSGPSGSNRR